MLRNKIFTFVVLFAEQSDNVLNIWANLIVAQKTFVIVLL